MWFKCVGLNIDESAAVATEVQFKRSVTFPLSAKKRVKNFDHFRPSSTNSMKRKSTKTDKTLETAASGTRSSRRLKRKTRRSGTWTGIRTSDTSKSSTSRPSKDRSGRRAGTSSGNERRQPRRRFSTATTTTTLKKIVRVGSCPSDRPCRSKISPSCSSLPANWMTQVPGTFLLLGLFFVSLKPRQGPFHLEMHWYQCCAC